MLSHAGFHPSQLTSSKEKDLFSRLQAELVVRYNVDSRLACEMASDLLEVLSAVDGDFDIFEKYFLQ